MSKTTVSLENRKKPAPRWYRKFENAFLLLILPGVGSLIQGWGLDPAMMNKVLLSLGFIGTVVKAIGFFLANGEDYAESKPFTLGKSSVIIAILAIGLLGSCSVDKKLTKAENLIENNGGFVLRDKETLPKECNDRYPCITTEKETTTTTSTKEDTTTNKAIRDSLKLLKDRIKELETAAADVSTLDECRKVVERYKAELRKAADEIDRLSAQIKNSTTTFTDRTEKLTVESSAKLAAKDAEIRAFQKRNDELEDDLNIATKLLEQTHTTINNHMNAHRSIGTTFKWFLGAVWFRFKWWIIVAGMLFTIYKLRKFIPYLKMLPI